MHTMTEYIMHRTLSTILEFSLFLETPRGMHSNSFERAEKMLDKYALDIVCASFE